jgi:carboxyl-terminal processing protease
MGQAMAELADEAKAQIQGGIGIGVSKDSPSGWLRVMTVLPNSPALAAGLKPGDLISEIDGKSLAALPLPDAVTRMRGIKLTTVTLTIRHDGSTNFEHAVIRRVSFKQVMQLSTGQR